MGGYRNRKVGGLNGYGLERKTKEMILSGKSLLAKIKDFKMNRWVWLCLLAAEVMLGAGVCFVQSRKEPLELRFTQEDLLYESGGSGFYVDMSYEKGLRIITPQLRLPKGIYTLEVRHERSSRVTTRIEVQYVDHRFGDQISGSIVPYDDERTTCDFRIQYGNRPFVVSGRLNGDAGEGDYLLFREVIVRTSPLAMRNLCLRLALLFFLVNLTLFLYSRRARFAFRREAVEDGKLLALLIFLSSIPLLVNYLTWGHDLIFHLTRLDGLRAGLEAGMFPVRIQPNWFDGHGYAASVFYGDIFLYLPALLCCFGVPLQTAYQLYVLSVNAATVCIAFFCFSRMGNRKAGLVCAAAYSLNIYRLVCLYTRVAVGEYTAMAFMPLVLYGFWKAYTLPEDSEEHRDSWITVSMGCCGIFLSHVLSTEMAAFFILMVCVILWKRTLRKRTLLVLLKAAAMTAGMTFWFLVPMADYMLSGSYRAWQANAGGRSFVLFRMEDRAAFPAQLFMTTYKVTGGDTGSGFGAVDDMPLTVGLALLLALAGWFFFCAFKKREAEERRQEQLALFLSVFSLVLTTCLFPYAKLFDAFPALGEIVSSLQYPWRFFTAAGIFLAWLLCVLLRKEWIDPKRRQVFAWLVTLVSVWQALAFMSAYLNTVEPVRAYYAGELSTDDVEGGEYLPMDAPQDSMQYTAAYVNRPTYDTDVISLTDWRREKGDVVVTLTNHAATVQQVEVPLLLYKGYHAIADSGEELAVSPGTSYRVAVSVPAGFSGSFRVAFREPWHWRVSEAVSLATLLGIGVFVARKRRRRIGGSEETVSQGKH